MAENRRQLQKKAFEAAMRGDMVSLQNLVRRGVDPCGEGPNGIFFAAFKSRRMEVFRFAEDHGADTSDVNDLLFVSISHQWLDLAELMLERGANINVRRPNGETPLVAASRHASGKVVRFLLDRGADPLAKDTAGRSALHIAAEWSNADALRVLLSCPGMNPNEREDRHGFTPLHLVDYPSFRPPTHCRRTIRLLLSHGADIEAPDRDGITPLSWTAEGSCWVVVDELIRAGARIEVRDFVRRTPLLVAAIFLRTKNVELLLQAGADIRVRDKWGATVLSYATRDPQLLRLLINAGADVNAVDKKGDTPLHVAATDDQHDSAVLLVDHGANPVACNKRGLTPFDVARKRRHREIAEFLHRAGEEQQQVP